MRHYSYYLHTYLLHKILQLEQVIVVLLTFTRIALYSPSPQFVSMGQSS